MTNLLQTLPVGKIIQNENTPDRNPNFEHYLIPYYQLEVQLKKQK